LKTITTGQQARKKLQEGIQILTDAVSSTMGPAGRNVIIEHEHRSIMTKDGVSVARSITLEDKEQNIGAQLVKEVAVNTEQEAGDGTTTSTVLANAIFKKGLKAVESGVNPVQLKNGMDKILPIILSELEKTVKQVENIKDLENIGTISANSDEKIGKMIAKAVESVGTDGVITVEEGKGIEDSIDIVKGMQFKKGFASPYFVTDTKKLEAVLDNPYVLLYNTKLNSLKEILPILEKVQSEKRELLIIADDIDHEALNTLVVNKMRNILKIVVVKTPGFSDTAKEYQKDIAALTNGNVINPSITVYFNNLDEDIGTCSKVTVTKDTCTIVTDSTEEAKNDKVQDRINIIKEQLSLEKEPYFEGILKERLAKLTGGVCVIKVGAPSDTETKEKKDRIDDALGATRAAQEEGIILGGGSAFAKISIDLADLSLNSTEILGAKIVLSSINKPLETIAENAGYNGALIVEKVKEQNKETGFNAATGKYVDMYKTGIIDSFKVARVALTNAISVSSMLLTTECIVSLKVKD